MKTIRRLVASIAFLLIAAPAVCAHHLWIEPANGKWIVARGIVPDRLDPYAPDCVREILAFDKDGKAVDVEQMDQDDRVEFIAAIDISLAAAWSGWGYRVNTTRGKRLIGRAEAETKEMRVLSAFYSTHYAKSLFSWSEAAKEPIGLRFEIIPLENPLESDPGSTISFKVLFDGKPLSGAPFYTENGNEATTSDHGVAAITVPEGETVLLYARHRIDVDEDERKDYDIFTTFLTFKMNR